MFARTSVLLVLLFALVFVSVTGIVEAKKPQCPLITTTSGQHRTPKFRTCQSTTHGCTKVTTCTTTQVFGVQNSSCSHGKKKRTAKNVRTRTTKSVRTRTGKSVRGCELLKNRETAAQKQLAIAKKANTKASRFALRVKSKSTRIAAAKVAIAYVAAKNLWTKSSRAYKQCATKKGKKKSVKPVKRAKRTKSSKRAKSVKRVQKKLNKKGKAKCKLVFNKKIKAFNILCNKKSQKSVGPSPRKLRPGKLIPFKLNKKKNKRVSKKSKKHAKKRVIRKSSKRVSKKSSKRVSRKSNRRARSLPKGCQIRQLGKYLTRVCKVCSVVKHKRTLKEHRVCRFQVTRCAKHVSGTIRCKKPSRANKCRKFKRCIGNKCTAIRSCKRKSAPRCKKVKRCLKIRNSGTGVTRTQCKVEKKCSRARGCRVIHKCKRAANGTRQCTSVTRCKNRKCKRVRANCPNCKSKRVCRKPAGTCKSGRFRRCTVIQRRGTIQRRTVCRNIIKRCKKHSTHNKNKKKKRSTHNKKKRSTVYSENKKRCNKKSNSSYNEKKGCRRTKKTGKRRNHKKCARRAKKCETRRVCKIVKNKKTQAVRKVCTGTRKVCGKALRISKCKAVRRCELRRNKKTGATRTVCRQVKRNTCPHHCRFVKRCQLRKNKKTGALRSVCSNHRVCTEGHAPRCKQTKKCTVTKNKKTGLFSTKCVAQPKVCPKGRCRSVKSCYRRKGRAGKHRMVCKRKRLCLPRRCSKKRTTRTPAAVTTSTAAPKCTTIKRCTRSANSKQEERIRCAMFTKCPSTCKPTRKCTFTKGDDGKKIVKCADNAAQTCNYTYTPIATTAPPPTPIATTAPVTTAPVPPALVPK